MVKLSPRRRTCVFLIIVIAILVVATLASRNRFRSFPTVEGESTVESDDVTISATIGTTTNMRVYGYAPASSQVFLTGYGISEERKADTNGYFTFGEIDTTGSSDSYPELCLVAYIGSLSTQPTCIPSLPGGSNTYEIGPVILSPIISIEHNYFALNSQVALNGYTIPNSKVSIYLAENESGIALVQKVLAYNMPAYETTSDKFGKFQFNLPSSTTAKWRVYAATTYNSSASPKSTTLNFTVQSVVSYYLKTIYETIVKTTTIITTAATAKSGESITLENEKSLKNISINDVYAVRYKLPYFVILAEGFLLILLVVLLLIRKKKKGKKTKTS